MDKEEAIALRLASQQLQEPQFESPEEIVDWMGIMQAQDYNHFRWAIGMRMREPRIEAVKQSFSLGKILRLHLLRCTVQVVTPQDLGWMTELCKERNLRTILSWPSYNQTEFSEQYFQEGTEALKEILADGKSLSKLEISEEMKRLELPDDTAHLNQILLRGEIEGLLCSGEMKDRNNTWALVSERMKDFIKMKDAEKEISQLTMDEPLALLARKYFRSHSPASFEDFCWWTGLTITQNRRAIQAIASELEEVMVENQAMFTYRNTRSCTYEGKLHLLPPYDEYLIGYKSRWISLDKKHEAKAHNRFGIFKPVILYEGRVVGNWKASIDQEAKCVETDIFARKRDIGVRKMQKAIKNFQEFCKKK